MNITVDISDPPLIQCVITGSPRPESKRNIWYYRNGTRVMGRVDTDEIKDYKSYCRACMVQARPPAPLDCPLLLHVVFYSLKPTGAPKKQSWPLKRPDTDNLIKPVKDAAMGCWWVDDARVCVEIVEKRFTAEAERIELAVYSLPEEPQVSVRVGGQEAMEL